MSISMRPSSSLVEALCRKTTRDDQNGKYNGKKQRESATIGQRKYLIDELAENGKTGRAEGRRSRFVRKKSADTIN